MVVIKKSDLEKLQLITDVLEIEPCIYLAMTTVEAGIEDVIGAKVDFTEKCMAAVCLLMDLKAGQDDGVSWEVESGVLTWTRNMAKRQAWESEEGYARRLRNKRTAEGKT